MHVYFILKADEKNMSSMQWLREWTDILDKHGADIVKYFSTSEELLDELISIGFITRAEEEDFKVRETSSKRNRRFLEILSQRELSQIQEFIKILKKCGQPSMAKCFHVILGKCIERIDSHN